MWRDQESSQERKSNILEDIKDSPETEQQEWQYNNLLYFHASKHKDKDKAEEVWMKDRTTLKWLPLATWLGREAEEFEVSCGL